MTSPLESAHDGDSWRPTRAPRWRRVLRLVSRVLASVLSLVLLWLFVRTVFEPWTHPSVRLLALTGANYDGFEVPPLAFLAEDLMALEPVADALQPRAEWQLAVLDRPEALTQLAAALNAGTGESDEVLIVYVAAHGISAAGSGYLLCGNFDAARPSEGRIAVRELLSAISRSPAHTKLLFLDAGRLTFDPRLGVLLNDFSSVLADEVAATGDKNLWVLSATSPGERSHVSAASQRSVFGFYVEQALKGAADLDGDGAIGLNELHRFVSKAVSNSVRDATVGAETQTPLLLAGNLQSLGRSPPIISPALGLASAAGPIVAAAVMAADFRQWTEAANLAGSVATAADTPKSAASGFVDAIQLPALAAEPLVKLAGSRSDTSPPAASAAAPPTAEAQGSESSKPHEAASSTAPTGAGAGSVDPAAPPQAAGAGNAGSEEKAAAPGTSPAAVADAREAAALEPLAEAMINAWRLRDELNQARGAQPRPVDLAPHRWRAVEARLLGLEQESMAGKSADPKAIGRRLRNVVAAMQRPDISDQAEDVLLASTRRSPLAIQQDVRPRSLALAAVLAARNGKTLPDDLAAAVQKLDALAIGPVDEAFWKWVESLPAGGTAYLELQWARQLRAMPGINPELRQRALEVCWLGERVAASALGAQAWIAPTIEAADRSRLTAERDLLDPGRLRDDRQLASALGQAAQAYRHAAGQLQIIKAARRLEHDLLDRAGDYVHWHSLAPIGCSAPVPASETIEPLLGGLRELVQQLGQPAPAALDRIEQLSSRLRHLREQVEGDLRPTFVASLLDTGGAAPWNAGLLLSTPLPTLESRLPLLAAAGRLDRPLLPASIRSDSGAAPRAAAFGEQTWRALRRRADLQWRLAHLAMIDCPHVEWRFENLAARYQDIVRAPPDDAGNVSVRLARWRDLEAALKDFYVALPDLIQASLGRSSLRSDQRETTLKHWRWADLASRLMDPRDVVRVKDQTPAQLIERAEFDALLAWQRTRLLASSEESTGDRAAYLSETAGDYFAALSADGYDVPADSRSRPVELHVPETLDLSRADRLATRLRVQAPRQATNVWLVVEYDPQRLAVRSADDRPLYFAERPEAASASRLAAPHVRPLAMSNQFSEPTSASPASAHLFDLPPSLQLAADAMGELKLAINRKAPSQLPASLIVSAWTVDRVTRESIEVRLPKPAFATVSVDGPPGCWEAGQAPKLFPFPNRTTPFRLLISRTDAHTASVAAELRVLAQRPEIPIPDTAMEPGEAAELLDRLPASRPIATVADVSLPEAGRAARLAFEPAAPPPAATAGGKEPAAPAAAGPPSLGNGLLMLITDRLSKRVMIRWIEFMPQRPRRYVDAHVDYDLAEQRIRLRLRPQQAATLPPGGSRIRWQMTGLDQGAAPGPAGEITRTAPDRVLSTLLSPQINPVTLLVDVDDYPRALAFRLQPDATAANVLQARLTAIKITSPAIITAYRLPSSPIAVRFQADVPSDDLSGSDDFIEVGLDTNRDRILQDEPSVRLKADRQTSVTLEQLEPGGTLLVRTEVQDLSAEIPTSGVASGRVGLLGRVCLGGKSLWSNSVELILDGQAPQIERVTIKPGGTVVRGSKLDVLATVSDDDLSGVAKVEVGFDLKELGKFAEDPAPVPASVDASGRWAAQLPTEALSLGGYQLLLRATDRVGNVSEYTSLPVRIVAAETAQAPLNQVRGSVMYGKEPMPQIQVTLAPEKGEKLPQVMTDERGNFVIRSVPPGKYTVSAAGVVRNKKRKAEAKLEVAAPPARPKPVEMELK